ncbi:MAG: HEPN domain-containing protein [bacterium]
MDEKEWFRQASYDIETADDMYKAGRYIYTVFTCHLAVEKGLKGIYYSKFHNEPPRIHSLTRLIKEAELSVPEDLLPLITQLSAASVPARYPAELRRLRKEYGRKKTAEILRNSRKVLKWLRKELKTS